MEPLKVHGSGYLFGELADAQVNACAHIQEGQ